MTLNMFIDNKAVLFLIIMPLIYFRGCIISDNGRNFIGPEVKEYTRFLNTEWNYILEHSPWWGGFWERLVQLVKKSLRKILRKNKLTFEEMSTVVTEIEGILNTRPLC